MTRSSYKGPYVDNKLIKKAQQAAQGKVIKTWSRASQIHPDFVGKTFGVHNGKVHTPVFVTEAMIGHRLGEFAPTRKFKGHPKKSATTSA